MGQSLMLQGTSSSVGKSMLTAAILRTYANQGYRVAPFKSQNMSTKTTLIPGAGEVSEVQAFQARAAKTEVTVDMNPILLKPVDDLHSEIIVQGKSLGIMSAKEYIEYKPQLLEVIADSLANLKANYDLIVIEGAGSPAEVNLRAHDLANMAVAKLAKAKVLLIADIEFGGVFAYVHGTCKLLLPEERSLLAGIIVNKFRGNKENFNEGVTVLEELTDLPVLGVIPYYQELKKNCVSEVNLDEWALHVCNNLDLSEIGLKL